MHPNNHVNMAQSTNNVIPTAIRLAALELLDPLLEALEGLEQALAAKGREFNEVLKSGRTHLQDAVPIRLGQEFTAYSVAVRRNREGLESCIPGLLELGIGGTAVGTGLNAEPAYITEIVEQLAVATGFPVTASPRTCSGHAEYRTLSCSLIGPAADSGHPGTDRQRSAAFIFRASHRPGRFSTACRATRLLDHARQG